MIASQNIGKSFIGALNDNMKKLSHPDPAQRAELLDMSFASLDRRIILAQVALVKGLKPAVSRYVYHTGFDPDEATITALYDRISLLYEAAEAVYHGFIQQQDLQP